MNVTIKFEVSITTSFHKILAVDLGERTIASTVLLCNGETSHPHFYGKTVRGIRRHYARLHKRLGEKKALKTIKKVGHAEKRKVNAILYKISKAIVEGQNEKMP
ncbi:hypothetical protein KEJ36_04400 [Candidatus Bathyarchaeota archaeon]|nr:hypothetical protein [Candidatus Bathyarchaeota archaeon]MBS7628034.1 hypothetical protein [Candidatus Bathyarchaeota archaeon]